MDWLLQGGAMVGSFFLQPLLVAILLVLVVLFLPLVLAGSAIYYVTGTWGLLAAVVIVVGYMKKHT